MKIILILCFFISFQSTLFAQDENQDSPKVSTQMGMGYPTSLGGFGTGMGYPGGLNGSTPKAFDVSKNPEISISLDDKKSISCTLDSATKTYVCPNEGNPILVRSSSFGFSALGRDKNKSATMISLSHVEASGKTLFDAPSMTSGFGGMGMGGFGGYGGKPIKPDDTKDLGRDFSMRLMTIDGFFETAPYPGAPKRTKGSAEYEKIAQSFMDEKQNIQDEMDKVYHEKDYSVELADGQKVNCERGPTRPLTEQMKKYETQMNMKFQCGSFKCDPVKVDGKEYSATMLYESTPGSMVNGTIHLIDKDGIGPTQSIKKIISPKTSMPLVDNSYFLENADKSYNSNYLSSMLPESLKQDRDKISMYKDPAFEQVVEYYKSICSDDDKALDNLLEGKKKLVAKLADLDMAQFIQVLGNGSLVGQFVDPTLAPQLGCLYQGVYLNEEAAKNLDRLKKNIHPDAHVDQTISIDRATELFNKAANMKDIAWKYKPDGCYARAHLMARRFEAEGVRVDKVWIKGDLYVPGTEPLIQWNFHVAPIVYVDDGKGNVQKMVIDPSLFEKPVTVEEWDHKMSKKTAKGSVVTAFPFPDNSAFMERSTLSFSSSDPYLPRDSINMTEQEKMNQANETMLMYKAVEPK